jgi:hypothetical protein
MAPRDAPRVRISATWEEVAEVLPQAERHGFHHRRSPRDERMPMNLTSNADFSVVAFHAMRADPGPEEQRLSDQACELMSALDQSLRPAVLAARYPRIVNKVAELWRRPRLMDRYFDELLLDDRGNRQGFPLDILLELTALKEHYQTAAFPMSAGVWDETNLTERFR